MKSFRTLWNFMEGNRLLYLGAILSVASQLSPPFLDR